MLMDHEWDDRRQVVHRCFVDGLREHGSLILSFLVELEKHIVRADACASA